MDAPNAFDRSKAELVSRRNLPHWRQDGALYFVTFRLADALPADRLSQWREELEQWMRWNPLPHTPEQNERRARLWMTRIQRWLDAGHGSCSLQAEPIARVVERSLLHFDRSRYSLGSYVIMPNHVHVLVAEHEGFSLSRVLHSWKSFTSNQVNRMLGREGTLWQDESFDHIVRSDGEWERIDHYICDNAVRAPGRSLLGRGSLVRS